MNEKKTLEIKLYERISENLSARVYGKNLCEEILQKYLKKPYTYIIVFDFDKIETISSGFSKELFGELLKFLGKDDFKNLIRIKLSNNNNKDIIKSIIYKGISSIKNQI